MTVVNPDSIAGITSVTSSGTTLEFYDVNGNLLDVSANLTGELTVGTGATISSPGASIIDFETNGSERLRIGSSGQLGIAGANYGTSGQVLTSAGSGSAVSWNTIPTQVTLNNNADNRVITGGSGVNLNGESNLTFDGTTVLIQNSGSGLRNLLRLKNSNASAGVSGLYFNSTTSGSAFDAACVRNGVNGSGQGRLFLQTNNGSGLVNGLEIEYDGQVTLPTNSLNILDSIVHIGDTNTKIRFPSADTITAETGGSERLRIDSSGRLLIGTTQYTTDKGVVIYGVSGRGADVVFQNASTGTGTGNNGFYVGNGTGDTAYLWNYENDDIALATNNTERLRITSAGAVKIGTGNGSGGGGLAIYGGTVNQSSGQDAALYVRHDSNADWGMWLYKQHEYGFRIDSNSSATLSLAIYDQSNNLKHQFFGNGNYTASGSVDSTSDIKLKTNIKTIDSALDKVLQLRGAEYDRIDKDNQHEIGVIAQEVEKVIPEVVHGDETKSVSYGNMTAVLIEAIKEQNEIINRMRKEIEDLKN